MAGTKSSKEKQSTLFASETEQDLNPRPKIRKGSKPPHKVHATRAVRQPKRLITYPIEDKAVLELAAQLSDAIIHPSDNDPADTDHCNRQYPDCLAKVVQLKENMDILHDFVLQTIATSPTLRDNHCSGLMLSLKILFYMWLAVHVDANYPSSH